MVTLKLDDMPLPSPRRTLQENVFESAKQLFTAAGAGSLTQLQQLSAEDVAEIVLFILTRPRNLRILREFVALQKQIDRDSAGRQVRDELVRGRAVVDVESAKVTRISVTPADGKGVVLMMLQGERFWPLAARTLGCEALLTDPQTSGGLLVACAPAEVDRVMAIFQRLNPAARRRSSRRSLSWTPARRVRRLGLLSARRPAR